jgi:hypothetical protein
LKETSTQSFKSDEKSWQMGSANSGLSKKKKPKRKQEAIKNLSKLQQDNITILNALINFGKENEKYSGLINEILSKPLES